jgi:hypothetical protein
VLARSAADGLLRVAVEVTVMSVDPELRREDEAIEGRGEAMVDIVI